MLVTFDFVRIQQIYTIVFIFINSGVYLFLSALADHQRIISACAGLCNSQPSPSAQINQAGENALWMVDNYQ